MAKAKKKGTENYEGKLKIEGTFADVIGVSVDVPIKDKKPKEQKEDLPGTDKDGLKKQDKPIK